MRKNKKRTITRSILEVLDLSAEKALKATDDFVYIFDRPYSILHRLLELGNQDISKPQFAVICSRLKKQKLIDISEENDKTFIHITENGKKKLLQYKLSGLKIKKPKVWDKKWRVVIFDIPEKRKLAREVLRQRLKELNFYQIQKSVWVHPYDISDIIEFLVTIYEIRPFVKLIVADSITDDWQIQKKFKIDKI